MTLLLVMRLELHVVLKTNLGTKDNISIPYALFVFSALARSTDVWARAIKIEKSIFDDSY